MEFLRYGDLFSREKSTEHFGRKEELAPHHCVKPLTALVFESKFCRNQGRKRAARCDEFPIGLFVRSMKRKRHCENAASWRQLAPRRCVDILLVRWNLPRYLARVRSAAKISSAQSAQPAKKETVEYRAHGGLPAQSMPPVR
jgi:hypothetical protein